MLRAGTLRHHVNVMRPAEATGTRGETRGEPQLLIKDWPCSITPTGGGETDETGGVLAQAAYVVEGYGNPSKPIMPKDYLLLNGTRVLHIAYVEDVDMNGLHLRLMCGEEMQRG